MCRRKGVLAIVRGTKTHYCSLSSFRSQICKVVKARRWHPFFCRRNLRVRLATWRDQRATYKHLASNPRSPAAELGAKKRNASVTVLFRLNRF